MNYRHLKQLVADYSDGYKVMTRDELIKEIESSYISHELTKSQYNNLMKYLNS